MGSRSGIPADSDPRFLTDFVSGKRVRATPEQRDAVQVFARRLVDELGYDRSLLQTQPQFRIRHAPSDSKGRYPVDIAVFSSPNRTPDSLTMIIECKASNRNDGREQLERYLEMSRAAIGVWFNGESHLYIRKVLAPDGTATFPEIPSLPGYGEELADIGQYHRYQLRQPTNLKATFHDIRNYLAANATGITRDEAFAQEIINVLFCKIYDEVHTAPDEQLTFRCGHDEDASKVHTRITRLFAKVRREYDDVFDKSDRISLDETTLAYVIGELQAYSVTDADRDAVGEAFEVFIGPALRGNEGQFFTPRNVVKLIVDLLDPKPGEMVLDPACGSGGFLIAALSRTWEHVATEAERLQWSEIQQERRRRDIATRYFRGIDRDAFLAKVTKAYLAIIGDGRGGIFCENALRPQEEWPGIIQKAVPSGEVDVILTNPPFGAKIKISETATLRQYNLAHKWTVDSDTGEFSRQDTLADSRPPQILFLERCLQLLKHGGRMGIVLPESLFGMPTHQYVVQYLLDRVRVRGVISMPEALFKTSGKGGTHTKVCVVLVQNLPPNEDYDIFMADAQWCGHDSRGNPTLRTTDDGTTILLDDLPLISDRFSELYGSPAQFWDVP